MKGGKGPYLVQMKDSDGFWCNLAEEEEAKRARQAAQLLANLHQRSVRVVAGVKRELIVVIGPRGETE